MDLREEVVAFRGHYREIFNWILHAGGTRSVVLAMGDRFPLLLLAQVLVRPMKLRAAVTTEAEARASVGLHRPDLLVCSDWLESGGVVSLVREARQEVPGMGVLMLLSHQDRGLRAADLRSLAARRAGAAGCAADATGRGGAGLAGAGPERPADRRGHGPQLRNRPQLCQDGARQAGRRQPGGDRQEVLGTLKEASCLLAARRAVAGKNLPSPFGRGQGGEGLTVHRAKPGSGQLLLPSV